MLQTNDLLNDLQSNLKKEVDELKRLIQETVIDMGLTPENKNRKIMAIYDRIRADCTERDLFDTNYETAEDSTMEMFEQLRRLFDNGPATIASEVVTELRHRIQLAIDKEEANYVTQTSDSVGLRTLLKQIETLR